MRAYLNEKITGNFSAAALKAQRPYPWRAFDELLTPDAFEQLWRDFPPLEKFEKHEGLERGYGQRPHNRYYLGYRESNYHPAGYQGHGVIQRDELPESWRSFLDQIETGAYRAFLESALETRRLTFQCAWHVAVTGSEVSPHKDTLRKRGIHLFYFNPPHAWDTAWGGETLILGGKRVPRENPDFSDFDEVIPVPMMGNRSLLIRNAANAWHGVRPLACPEGRFRRLFAVIAEGEETLAARLIRLGKRVLGGPRYAGSKG